MFSNSVLGYEMLVPLELEFEAACTGWNLVLNPSIMDDWISNDEEVQVAKNN